MKTRFTNKIRKINIEVEFEDAGDPLSLKDSVSQACNLQLLPELEKLFNEKAGKDKSIRIENIILDVGKLDQENWKEDLVKKVVLKLMEYLGEVELPAATPSEEKLIKKLEYDSRLSSQNNMATVVTEYENILHSVLHFLKTGLLPWYTVIKSRKEFNQQIDLLLHHPEKHFYFQLIEEMRSDTTTIRRLVDQFEESALERILVLSDIKVDTMRRFTGFWRKMLNEAGMPLSTQRHVLYVAAFTTVIENTSHFFSEFFHENVVKQLGSNQIVHLHKLCEKSKLPVRFVGDDAEVGIFHSVVLHIKHEYKRRIDGKEPGIRSNDPVPYNTNNKDHIAGSPQAEEMPGAPESNRSGLPLKHTDPVIKRHSNQHSIIIENEGIFINNAGLVILNPFLMGLFKNVGYVEEKQWISEELQQRAICLMQYMATGKQEFGEFDLLLNKVLTGYPLEQSLPADIQLSDFEIQEANEVLNSLIKHWSALKNTSVQSVQTTFLLREGKLTIKDLQWVLQVEQQTVDILLNKLPWGISIIKFPWMEKRLHVEWT